jgi:Succinate dehydrogenase/fumarate reductase, flavoprotein subunit
MKKDKVLVKGIEMEVYSLNTVIVGSGAAGFNAADSLYNLGQKDIAIVTEGLNMGTSRNTGSDKQTYYKITLAGDAKDSVQDMAATFFEGGSRHGDIALVEAALSARCFYKLVDIGVPFPHGRYGEYAGYKTDHDPRQRATSAGPLTSRYMTEKLEQQVKAKGIPIFDGFMVIAILTKKEGDICSAVGLIALDSNRLDEPCMGMTLFNCTNIIYATGGPAGMYLTSVYPQSQTGSTGIALEAGARGVNLTESQYGIASIKFRWNLSGTYQQVIPRYVSTDKSGGDEREFLDEYFENPGRMMDAIFLKGYQWPFDPRKISNAGSSLIDILVHYETQVKGRRVFMDFMHNPCCSCKNGEMDFSQLGTEAYEYLKNSGALFGLPIDRLLKMNKPAVELYKNNDIDLTSEYLEIAVCAQHNNGGLLGDLWWESNLRHFFPVGEVNGSFGVYRPGGSALNSTQVGSLRAAQYINANYSGLPESVKDFISLISSEAEDKLALVQKLASKQKAGISLENMIFNIKSRMSAAGAHIRGIENVRKALYECREDFNNFCNLLALDSIEQLPDAFRVRDMLITQYAYLDAIREYIEKGGKSRGSYLVVDNAGMLPAPKLPEDFMYSLDDGGFMEKLCEVSVGIKDGAIECSHDWKTVRPIPREDNWFENVWNDFINGKIII